MRLGLFFGSLILALLIGVLALQVPAPRGADAAPDVFSTVRAMADIRQIARAPHPVGDPEHARVQAYLVQRMTQLGLAPTLQSGPLSPEAVARLARWRDAPPVPGERAVNIVGILAGRDPAAPAVMMMAHYDSAWGSPGAADDATGVAAILEAVRAIKARGPIERTLVVLITDAEELNLDGARLFFSEHPLRDRIGMVVNLEARGGGGRATMFETGIDNAGTIPLFSRAMRRADGGTTATSLAGYVYALTPNGTDFTIPRERGIGGVNFAFIGRPSQYHSPTSTPEALDPGSVQSIGSQALEVTDTLLRVPQLPEAGPNRVYADILGRVVIGHATGTGWLLVGLTVLMAGFAVWRSGTASRSGLADMGRGMLGGLWLVASGLVLIQAVRVLAGPLTRRVESADAYYTLLRRLPWMEGATVLAVVAVALVLLAGREGIGRRVVAGVIAGAALLATVLGGFDPVVLVAAVIAIGLTLWSQGTARTPWGQWLGLVALIALLAVAGQALAPEAGFLFVWMALLAAFAAALTALIDPRMERPVALVPAAIVTVIGGAWLVGLAHGVFLGIGMDFPGALIIIGLLVLLLARPLGPRGSSRALAAGAAACLILACGLSVSGRIAEPMPAPAPGGPS